MANTILKAEQILSAGLGVLERDVVLPSIIASDASRHFSSRSPKNDTVSIRVAGRTVAKDKPWRDKSAMIEISDLNEFKVDVKLDTHPYNAIELTDEELTLDIDAFTEQVITPQTRSVVERLEDKIAAKISTASYPLGSLISIGEDFYAAAVKARKELNDYHVPAQGRTFLVGTAVEQAVLLSDQFRKFDQSGDSNALREATIGRVAGFDIVVSNSIHPNEAFAFHRSAFQAVYRVPATPLGGVTTAAGSYAGVALRWVRDYESDHMVNRSVFDTFFGINVVQDPDDYEDPDSTFSLKRAVKLTLGDLSYQVDLGGATAGNFTLTLGGRTTANIAYNATVGAVKSAIVALDDGYTADNVTVTGSTGGPYTITVPGSLSGSGAGLTGGSLTVTQV